MAPGGEIVIFPQTCDHNQRQLRKSPIGTRARNSIGSTFAEEAPGLHPRVHERGQFLRATDGAGLTRWRIQCWMASHQSLVQIAHQGYTIGPQIKPGNQPRKVTGGHRGHDNTREAAVGIVIAAGEQLNPVPAKGATYQRGDSKAGLGIVLQSTENLQITVVHLLQVTIGAKAYVALSVGYPELANMPDPVLPVIEQSIHFCFLQCSTRA